MAYKIAKLVSDYVSPGIYVNRLELGDAMFGGPVDLRFIGEPGWIENAHSVFFGVNGRDAYYPTNTGGLISTSDTGDLVFFDPSNDVGRTLSQLYAGAGLWEVGGAYAKLSIARPLDIGEQNIDNVGERIQFDTSQIYSKIQFHGTADALIYTHTEAPDPVVDRWDFFINDVSRLTVGVAGIDAWVPLDMNGEKITGLPAAGAAGEAIAAGTDGYIPLANVPLGAPGVKGDILIGTEAGCGTLYTTANNGHVLTLDDTETLGVKWAAGAGGVTDHGALTGLADDDHTQYLLATGARAMSGNLDMGGGVGSNDIVNVIRVAGRTASTLIIDFRGDDLNDIFFDTSNRLSYRAANKHVFSIGSDAICEVHATGIELDTGLNFIADGGKVTGLTSATADGDAIAAGTDGYIPLANVPLGAPGVKGDILVGTVAGCGTLYTTANNGHVLTLDDTETLGVKWAASSGGGLWEDMGSYVRLLVADDVDFRAKNILHLASARSEFAAGMTIFDSNGATKAYLGTNSYALSAVADISMGTSWRVKNLADPASARDAANQQWVDAHNWAATDITSGTLPVSRGGTGVTGDTYDADKVDGWHVVRLSGAQQTIPNGSGYNWYFTISSGTSMTVVPGISMNLDQGWYSGLTTYVYQDQFGASGIKIVVWNASGSSRNISMEAIVIYY